METQKILDSGNRRSFESGAVRDICEGKGRCDLLPFDVMQNVIPEGKEFFGHMNKFIREGSVDDLYLAARVVIKLNWQGSVESAILDLAKHYEEGAVKYEERNWEKGIPVHCYVDSATRHFLKYLRGDKDEPHARAVLWNIYGCIWTIHNRPEFDDMAELSDKGLTEER